jgi:hypothetical protein
VLRSPLKASWFNSHSFNDREVSIGLNQHNALRLYAPVFKRGKFPSNTFFDFRHYIDKDMFWGGKLAIRDEAVERSK